MASDRETEHENPALRETAASGRASVKHEPSTGWSMMGEFAGKVVIVTGGALGIGAGISSAFAQAGASVAIADVNEAAANEQAEQLTSAGNTAMSVIGDVSRAQDAGWIIDAVIDRFGRLDVLVNNAGIHPMDSFVRAEDTSEELWDRILGINLKGVFLMSKHALPEIRRSGGGVIVNIASVQGLQSMPGVPAYAASKGGVLSLTRNLALDYAPDKIRVVAICPGVVESEIVRAGARSEGGDVQANLKRYGSLHPVGHIGQPSDIASAAMFLASDEARFITGEHLCVDGGLMALGAWADAVGR